MKNYLLGLASMGLLALAVYFLPQIFPNAQWGTFFAGAGTLAVLILCVGFYLLSRVDN